MYGVWGNRFPSLRDASAITDTVLDKIVRGRTQPPVPGDRYVGVLRRFGRSSAPRAGTRGAQTSGGTMRLLVTGGAGYIGSVVASALIEAGHDVTVLDDLSTGHADAVPPKAAFVRGTLRDDAARVLAEGTDAVLHFAAKSLVGESVANPALYWSNNLGGSLALLEAMRETGVRRIVFSSTAAAYGEPERTPIEETDPTRPTSPYGASKVAVDTALAEYARMYGFGAVSLRYFNVAGAHEDTSGQWYGERHSP
jgi:UDP-glucose 4-epimerase